MDDASIPYPFLLDDDFSKNAWLYIHILVINMYRLIISIGSAVCLLIFRILLSTQRHWISYWFLCNVLTSHTNSFINSSNIYKVQWAEQPGPLLFPCANKKSWQATQTFTDQSTFCIHSVYIHIQSHTVYIHSSRGRPPMKERFGLLDTCTGKYYSVTLLLHFISHWSSQSVWQTYYNKNIDGHTKRFQPALLK